MARFSFKNGFDSIKSSLSNLNPFSRGNENKPRRKNRTREENNTRKRGREQALDERNKNSNRVTQEESSTVTPKTSERVTRPTSNKSFEAQKRRLRENSEKIKNYNETENKRKETVAERIAKKQERYEEKKSEFVNNIIDGSIEVSNNHEDASKVNFLNKDIQYNVTSSSSKNEYKEAEVPDFGQEREISLEEIQNRIAKAEIYLANMKKGQEELEFLYSQRELTRDELNKLLYYSNNEIAALRRRTEAYEAMQVQMTAEDFIKKNFPTEKKRNKYNDRVDKQREKKQIAKIKNETIRNKKKEKYKNSNKGKNK